MISNNLYRYNAHFKYDLIYKISQFTLKYTFTLNDNNYWRLCNLTFIISCSLENCIECENLFSHESCTKCEEEFVLKEKEDNIKICVQVVEEKDLDYTECKKILEKEYNIENINKIKIINVSNSKI